MGGISLKRKASPDDSSLSLPSCASTPKKKSRLASEPSRNPQPVQERRASKRLRKSSRTDVDTELRALSILTSTKQQTASNFEANTSTDFGGTPSRENDAQNASCEGEIEGSATGSDDILLDDHEPPSNALAIEHIVATTPTQTNFATKTSPAQRITTSLIMSTQPLTTVDQEPPPSASPTSPSPPPLKSAFKSADTHSLRKGVSFSPHNSIRLIVNSHGDEPDVGEELRASLQPVFHGAAEVEGYLMTLALKHQLHAAMDPLHRELSALRLRDIEAQRRQRVLENQFDKLKAELCRVRRQLRDATDLMIKHGYGDDVEEDVLEYNERNDDDDGADADDEDDMDYVDEV